MLIKITGPACPRCGSRMSVTVFDRPGVRQCERCGTRYQHREAEPEPAPEPEPQDQAPPVVTYQPDPVRCTCPECGARNPPVISAPKPKAAERRMRHHRCGCGHAFVSFEG